MQVVYLKIHGLILTESSEFFMMQMSHVYDTNIGKENINCTHYVDLLNMSHSCSLPEDKKTLHWP